MLLFAMGAGGGVAE